jgi:DNA processing protein
MDVATAVALSIVSGVPRLRLVDALRTSSEAGPASSAGGPGLIDALLCETRPPDDASQEGERIRRQVDQALARAARRGLRAVPFGDAAYPSRLAAIFDPPPVLWVDGRAAPVERPAVAIVGSRSATPYALEVARHLGMELGRRGVEVVSGLARGVDSAAHHGALDGGGRTIAVLGSGADVIYPAEHAPLAREIAATGAIVSELLPGTSPRKQFFPRRNRIISGWSMAVVVVEASERSGSLITAASALEQGRDVMVVPGNVLSGRNRGSHALLRDGAKIVESVDDILDDLGAPGGAPRAPAGHAGESGDPVLHAMAPGDTYDLDALAALAGLDPVELLPRLLDLELGGAVRREPGGRYALARAGRALIR